MDLYVCIQKMFTLIGDLLIYFIRFVGILGEGLI